MTRTRSRLILFGSCIRPIFSSDQPCLRNSRISIARSVRAISLAPEADSPFWAFRLLVFADLERPLPTFGFMGIQGPQYCDWDPAREIDVAPPRGNRALRTALIPSRRARAAFKSLRISILRLRVRARDVAG